MKAPELNTQLQQTLGKLLESVDELRDLDQVLGDGDLGITVGAGSKGIIEALKGLGPDATLADIFKASAKAFANGNPSTMAALVAGALLNCARQVADLDDLTVADAAALAKAGGDAIAKRGKTSLGDKTILDAIVPAGEALAEHLADADAALAAAIDAAHKAVVDTTNLQSQKGRAAWLQERSIGLQDPGATAFWRFLLAWQAVSK